MQEYEIDKFNNSRLISGNIAREVTTCALGHAMEAAEEFKQEHGILPGNEVLIALIEIHAKTRIKAWIELDRLYEKDRND